MIQITYQKRDGNIIQRHRSTKIPYKVGETTSMGWKVLKVEYEYNNAFYPEYKYNVLVYKDKQKQLKRKEIIEDFKKILKTILYYFIIITAIKICKVLIGI